MLLQLQLKLQALQNLLNLFQAMTDPELFSFAKQLQVPIDLLRETAKLGRLPVVNFAAGGLGNDAIF